MLYRSIELTLLKCSQKRYIFKSIPCKAPPPHTDPFLKFSDWLKKWGLTFLFLFFFPETDVITQHIYFQWYLSGVRDISYLLFQKKKKDYSTFKCYSLKNLNGPKNRLHYFSFLFLWFWAERDPFLTALCAHISNKQEKCSFPWPILSIMSELFWAVLFCARSYFV